MKRFGRSKKHKLNTEIENLKQALIVECEHSKAKSARIRDLDSELCKHTDSFHYRGESIRIQVAPARDSFCRNSFDYTGMQMIEIVLNIKPILLGYSLNKRELLDIKNNPQRFSREVVMKIERELIKEFPKLLEGLK